MLPQLLSLQQVYSPVMWLNFTHIPVILIHFPKLAVLHERSSVLLGILPRHPKTHVLDDKVNQLRREIMSGTPLASNRQQEM